MKGLVELLVVVLAVEHSFTVLRLVCGNEIDQENRDGIDGYNSSAVNVGMDDDLELVTEGVGLDDDDRSVTKSVGLSDDNSSVIVTENVGLDDDDRSVTKSVGLGDDNSSVIVTESVGLDDDNSSVTVTETVRLGGDNKSVTVTEGSELNVEDAFGICRQMLNALPPLLYNNQLNYYPGVTGQKYAEGWSVASGYNIHHVLRFHSIGPVYEDPETTYVCAGLNDASSYTYSDKPSSGGRPIAWITSHTRPQIAIGVVKLNTRCWRNTKYFYGCSPVFYPRRFMYYLQQFKLSPLDELFWANFSSREMGIPSDWIWKINIETNATTPDINIPPEWINAMDIPNLSELFIKGNNWEEPDIILPYSPALLYLDLSNNSLKSVPQDMLKNVPALRYLDLSFNNIFIFPDGIQLLKNLNYLDLSHSKAITTLSLFEDNIKNLPQTLEVLKLEETLLTVDFDDLLILPLLKFLNISGCSLDGFPFDTAPDLGHSSGLNDSMLTEIDFSKNVISSLTSGTFKTLVLLEKLNLSKNNIDYIDCDIFQGNVFLSIINLSFNKIKFIPSCVFCGLSRLQAVDLSHNQLKELPYFNSVKLIYLGLAYNKLNEFKLNSSFIDYVDLSHNNVSKLEISLIKKLNLSYNSLSYISFKMWNDINRLQIVDLGGNDFQCCLLQDTIPIKNYNTLILNLGTSKPVTCGVRGGTNDYIISNITAGISSCSDNLKASEPTSIGTYFIIGLAIVFVVVIIIVILVLAYRCFNFYFSKTRSQKWYVTK